MAVQSTVEGVKRPPKLGVVGRTASKTIRRQQLIDATILSISKFGISGTTMQTVTQIAGLSLGIVNFHFKNKDTLFEETLRYLAQEHRDHWRKGIADAGQDAAAQLLAIVDAHYDAHICSRKKLTVWFGFYGEAGYRASYRKIMAEIDRERWDTSKKLCSQIISEGKYKDVRPEDVAKTLEGLYDGLGLNILIYPGKFTRNQARAHVHNYLATTFPAHFFQHQ